MKPNAKGFDANASVCLRDVERGEGGRIPEDRTNAGSRPRPPIISSHVRALLRALSLYLCLPPYCPKERAVTAAAAATVETAVKRDRIAPLSLLRSPLSPLFSSPQRAGGASGVDMTSIRFQRGHVKKLLLLPSFLPSRYRLHLSQIQREGERGKSTLYCSREREKGKL